MTIPSAMVCPTCGRALPVGPAGSPAALACPACGAPPRAPAGPAVAADPSAATLPLADPAAPPPAAAAATLPTGATVFPSGPGPVSLLPPPPDDTAGRPFGRYTLRAVLGSGAMGMVWKAWDPELGRVVALKQLRLDAGAGAEAVARFQREARLAGRLHHPNIVGVHDVGIVDGRYYLTMDFVEGRTFAARLAEARPQRSPTAATGTAGAPDRAGADGALRRDVELLALIAEAVAYAHREGVVHRDLKPANVLLDAEGRPHVTDFGLAKETAEAVRPSGTGAATAVTLGGQVIGTPAYMSPEQARGEVARVGPATDVWALGVMLYEVLAGDPPFRGATGWEVLAAVCGEEPEPPRRRNPRAPADLEAVCLCALARDPARRCPTAADLASDLRRWLGGDPVSARPSSFVGRSWRAAARRRQLWLPAVAAAAALALATGWVGRERIHHGARERTLLAQIETAVRGLEDQVKRTRMPDEARNALATQPLGLLDRLVADAPECAPAYAWRGRVHELLDDDARAGADFERACALDPAHPRARFLRGMFLIRRYTWARGYPRRAFLLGRMLPLPTRPETSDERRWRETGLADLEAGARAPTAAAREPADPISAAEWAIGRATAAFFSGRPEANAEVLQILSGVTHPQACKIRGRTLVFLERYAEAEAAFTRTVEDWPLDAEGWVGRASARECQALVAQEKGEDPGAGLTRAIDDLGEALRCPVDLAPIFVLRANLLRQVGLALAERGQDPRPTYARALADLDEASRRAPGTPAHLSDRGAIHLVLSQAEADRGTDPEPSLRRALADLDTALRLDPALSQALFNRGVTCRCLGIAAAARGQDPGDSFARALADFTEALRADPENAALYADRANTHLHLGEAEAGRGLDPRPRFRAAIADAAEAARRVPGAATVHGSLGNACMRLGEAEAQRGGDPAAAFRRGIDAYAEALRLNPGFTRAWGNRGNAWLLVGQFAAARGQDPRASYGKAIADYGEALRLNPQFIDARCHRGAAHVVVAEEEAARGVDPVPSCRRALADLDEALRVRPGDAQAHNNRGLAYRELADHAAAAAAAAPGGGGGGDPGADYARAIADFDAALAASPGMAAALSNRGRAWLGLGRAEAARGRDAGPGYTHAEQDFRAAIQRHNALGWIGLGEVLAATGRCEEAVAAFEAGARAVPSLAAWARARIEEIRRPAGATKR